MSTRLRNRRFRAGMLGVPALFTFVLLAVLSVMSGSPVRPTKAGAIPVPLPVYQIDAVSGSHHASLLNLPVGQPGVFQAPIPVDVDGDLIPDVTVAVNLINVDGALLNPPQIGQVIAPNIQINRLITAPVLGQSSPPLRIQAKLTVKDVGGSNPDTVVSFGYDTGPGGTIPQFWKATVAGLDKFFNPIQAVIDTTGQQLGLHPGIQDFRLGPIAAPYQGPLSVIGGVQMGSTNATVDLNYRPFPNAVQVTYGTDSQGQHITYAHGVDSEVDLTSKLNLTTSNSTVNAVARVDRLPRAIALDLNQSSTGGSIDYRSRPNARLPDAQVDLTTTSVGNPPLVAHADIEQLPATMHGEWNINGASKQAHAAFSSSGTGIGAIEARVANFVGAPIALVPWVPDQRQYASIQQVPIPGGTEQLIVGRAERLRNISFDQNGGGYAAHVGVGDGELPFVAHIGLDQRPAGPKVEARAQISPLPDSIDMSFTPPGTDQSVNPLKVTYDSSQSVDVDAHVELRQPAAAVNAACGAPNTTCATFAARSIPAHLEARIRDGLTTPQGQPESRIELDDIPRPGGIQPDFRADVTLGQQDAAPLLAHAELDGLSRFVRIRAVQGLDQTLQRLEFHTCDYTYTATGGSCATGSEDEIGAVKASVRDFVTRPANLPEPASPAPLFAGVTARGDDANANLVNFEAVARMTHIRELQYVNAGGTFGVRTRMGGGQNFATDVDVKGVRLPQLAGQRVDLGAHALILPLPDTINICFKRSGDPLVNGTDTVTQPCESADPFGDGTGTASPMVFSWQASSPFSTVASVKAHLDNATPTDPTDDVAAAATIKVDNIPGSLTAKVGVPTNGTSGPVRLLTSGPPGSNINLNLHGELTIGGASCNDPNPGHDVACADATVTHLPTNMSALFDGAKNASRVEFHACDFRFFDASPMCRAGTASQIDMLTVDGHLVKGHPGPLGVLDSSAGNQVLLQARQKSQDDLALRARATFLGIRGVVYKQTADGFDAGYDVGDGTQSLEAKAQVDTLTGLLPDASGLRAASEVLITPLPAQITVRQHGPGDGANAAPMVLTYDASSPVHVQAHAQVFLAPAALSASPACGLNGTACATVDLQKVPSHLQATIGQSETAPANPGDPVDHHTRIDVDSTKLAAGKPDLVIDALVGLPDTTPLVGTVPVRAHVELLGLPVFVTAHMDEHVTHPGAANEQRDLQKVSIRTCQLDNADGCVTGTEDQLDKLFFEAQNFVVRPLDFPAPNAGITSPLWATVTGRGLQFQAAVNLVNINEATYVNHQATATKGFQIRVGDNDNLQARVDVKGLPLGTVNLGDLTVDNATGDVLANLAIKPLPAQIAICMRQSGLPIVVPSGDVITAPCEDTQPFGATVGTPAHTPMSFAYRANVPINHIDTSVDAAIFGNAPPPAGHPAIDARRVHGELGLDNIPKSITAHILTPLDDGNGNAVGPTRVRYDAPSTGPGINVHFKASQTQGDSVCQDPRPSATALCVGADLLNLPKHVELRYEPDKLSNNFHAETATDFAGKMDFKNLELSSVKPKVDGTGHRVPGQADVLVATGQILGIDDHVTVDGNINMPHDPNKAGSIDMTASIKIDRIDLLGRNYIAPDPFTAPIPDRPVYKDPASPANLDLFTVQARPLPDGRPAFKATAAIHNVAGFGYHQIAAANGSPIGTSVINVNFGHDFAVRAYADVVTQDGSHATGDVLLEHIPAGLQFCFRGAKADTTPPPAAGQPVTLCDDETFAAKKDGVFQFLGTPLDPSIHGVDVDAFLRAAAPGGTKIVSGRLNVDQIPYRIDGILPTDGNGGRLDVSAKDSNGNPQGIAQIRFNAASFDFPSGTVSDLQSGYTSPTPGFVPILNQSAPFPPPTPATQYLSAVASGDPAGPFAFQAVGRLGGLTGSVSRLQRIFSSATACTKPTKSDAGPRPDWPLFPTADTVSTYRCIGADLQQTDPSTPDPFALSVKYLAADGTLGQLRDAGISDLPGWFQVDIAQTKLLDGANDALRRRCDTAAVETANASAAILAYRVAHPTTTLSDQEIAQIVVTDCMPALVRFDQPLAAARLFGVAELGKPSALDALAGLTPKEAVANTDAIPRADGWDNANDDSISQQGIRAKVLTQPDGTTAARGSFRLPIPQSVTVDQVQSASVHSQKDDAHYFDGSDLRFHYVVRDNNGAAVPSLGELSALYQGKDGSQVLVGAPCSLNPHDRVTNNSFGNFSINTPFDCNPDWRHGVTIPGEIGVSMYTRDNLGSGQKYIQVDGRLSADVSAALRLIGNDPSGVGRIEAELKNAPGPLDKNNNADPSVGPNDATFRLGFLSKGDPQHAPAPTPPPPPGPAPKKADDCLFCVTSNIRLASAFASFNFHPNPSDAKARRVEATLNHSGAKNGLEVQSFDHVKDGANTPISADAYLLVDPLNISAFLNLAPTLEHIADQIANAIVSALDLPGFVKDIIGGVLHAIADLIASLVHVDFNLESRFDASVHIQSRHVTLRENLLHVKVINVAHDPSDDVTVGPFDLYIHTLKANANFGFTIHTPWPFPDINIGLTLLTIYYLPALSDIVPFLIKYLNCDLGFSSIADALTPPFPGGLVHAQGSNDANVVIWPMEDPRLIFGGIIGDIINAIPGGRMLGGYFFCIPGADPGDISLGAPGDTFNVGGSLLWPQHPIFDSSHLADSALTPGSPLGVGPPPGAAPAAPAPAPTPPAAAPSNGPDFTVLASSTVAMCGVQNFGTLKVQATGVLQVASATNGSTCLAAADVGKLIVKADHIINLGTIDGHAAQLAAVQPPSSGNAPTGNAGGGHAGVGGAGTPGTGGDAYANMSTTPPNGQKNASVSEVGAPGSAAAGGVGAPGGGLVILLSNNEVQSSGVITADGGTGTANTTGACASDEVVNNAPPPGTHIVHHPNSGVVAPTGAGAGGGIVLAGSTIDLRGGGSIHALGGRGGDSKKGSSGGGGGGVVKMLGPVQLFDAGFTPGVNGGDPGTNLCAGVDVPSPESSSASAGAVGTVVQIVTPTGIANSLTTFWNQGSGIVVPFTASGALQAVTGFTTVLCGLHTNQTTLPSSVPHPPPSFSDLFTVASTNSPSSPCGAGGQVLGSSHITGVTAVSPGDAGAAVTVNLPGGANEGLWGVWAITLRPTTVGQDCAVTSAGCTAEPPPAKVDQVFGVDNTSPVVAITAPADGFLTKSTSVVLSFTTSDPQDAGAFDLSHVVLTECRNATPGQLTTAFKPCASGDTFNLVPGDGAKRIEVRSTDGAGNTAVTHIDGILSNSPPSASATPAFGPNGTNGWYTTAPSITISGYGQQDGVPPQASTSADTGPYRYRFDNLPEQVCTTDPCVVPASSFAALPAGTHTFSFAAVDALGNRLFGSAMQVMDPTLKWDPDKPITQLNTVPLAPNVMLGGNGWFTTRPFIVLSALDLPGGSGLDKTMYRLDGSGGFVVYDVTNPPQLTNGVHSVEFFSTDLAGNAETTQTVSNIRVDDTPPASAITVSGGTLSGSGWYVAAPTVGIGGFNDGTGSGAPPAGELHYRVDNGNDVSCDSPCDVAPTLTTGQRLVGIHGVDAVGNVAHETGQTIQVDTEPPHTTVSLRSPVPDGLNRWYRSLPWVVLSADDQPAGYGRLLPVGSGVADTLYSLDGGTTFTHYSGPFQVAGSHVLCVKSVDVAGNVEPVQCLPPVQGDNADPTTAIAVTGTTGGAGWYIGAATVTVTSSDPTPGSGLVQPGATRTACYDDPGPDPVAAGTCVSIDGRKFAPVATPTSAPIVLNEGVHHVQAYSVDAAGHRGPVASVDVRVDLSPPVTTARTLPPYPARNGWFRAFPRVVLQAVDGDQNSGVAATLYKLDTNGWLPYTGPIDVGNGLHTVQYQSVDMAGLVEPVKSITLNVDTTPPVAIATSPEPGIWLQLLSILGNILGLSPPQARLHWIIGDAISSKATVRVVVYDVTGNVVRQLDGGTTDGGVACAPTCAITPGVNLSGYTTWDGKDLSLTGILPVGLYYYRVVVYDDAGNYAQSGESRPIQIKASLGL